MWGRNCICEMSSKGKAVRHGRAAEISGQILKQQDNVDRTSGKEDHLDCPDGTVKS